MAFVAFLVLWRSQLKRHVHFCTRICKPSCLSVRAVAPCCSCRSSLPPPPRTPLLLSPTSPGRFPFASLSVAGSDAPPFCCVGFVWLCSLFPLISFCVFPPPERVLSLSLFVCVCARFFPFFSGLMYPSLD